MHKICFIMTSEKETLLGHHPQRCTSKGVLGSATNNHKCHMPSLQAHLQRSQQILYRRAGSQAMGVGVERKAFWSFGGARSRGVAILTNPALEYHVDSFHYDTVGRFLLVDLCVVGEKYRQCTKRSRGTGWVAEQSRPFLSPGSKIYIWRRF